MSAKQFLGFARVGSASILQDHSLASVQKVRQEIWRPMSARIKMNARKKEFAVMENALILNAGIIACVILDLFRVRIDDFVSVSLFYLFYP